MYKNISITVAAAMEPAISRRQMLTGMAAASASAAMVATPSPAKSEAASDLPKGNPDLLKAHAELLAARTEHEEAKAALEWLVDEWRHLWPLAPEELLESAGAHKGSRTNNTAERDIAGRYLMRDSNILAKRLSKKYREENVTTCFHLLAAESAERIISIWENHKPKGRTEKALARDRAYRQETLRKYRERLPIAKAYETETARLRVASGVDAATERIRKAELRVANAASDISYIPAHSQEDLAIKAEVLSDCPIFKSELVHYGPLGDMARLIQSVIDMAGRA